MNGWRASDNLKLEGLAAISGIVTNSQIGRDYAITAQGARFHVVKLTVSGVTVVGAITAKLQSAISSDWVDSKTVSISGNGAFYIKLLADAAGDQTYLPLLNKARIVVTTTNAGDALTVDSIEVLQPL